MKKIPFNNELVRFTITGGINTVVTYVAYLILLIAIPYRIAYVIAYMTGIVISYYLNSLWVFKEKIAISKAIKYPLVYVIQAGLSVVFLSFFVETLGVPQFIAPILVILGTIPITFILSRIIIKGSL